MRAAHAPVFKLLGDISRLVNPEGRKKINQDAGWLMTRRSKYRENAKSVELMRWIVTAMRWNKNEVSFTYLDAVHTRRPSSITEINIISRPAPWPGTAYVLTQYFLIGYGRPME